VCGAFGITLSYIKPVDDVLASLLATQSVLLAASALPPQYAYAASWVLLVLTCARTFMIICGLHVDQCYTAL